MFSKTVLCQTNGRTLFCDFCLKFRATRSEPSTALHERGPQLFRLSAQMIEFAPRLSRTLAHVLERLLFGPDRGINLVQLCMDGGVAVPSTLAPCVNIKVSLQPFN